MRTLSQVTSQILGRIRRDTIEPADEWQPARKVIEITKELPARRQVMKTLNPLKVPFGTAKGVALRGCALSSIGGRVRGRFWDGLTFPRTARDDSQSEQDFERREAGSSRIGRGIEAWFFRSLRQRPDRSP